MIEFYVIDDEGDKFLRRSTDEFGEYSFERIDNIDEEPAENLVKAKLFTLYRDCDKFIGSRLYVLKVKGYPQNYQLGVYCSKSSGLCTFLCPDGDSEIKLDNNSISVFWELSTDVLLSFHLLIYFL